MGPFRTPPERKYSFSGFTTTQTGTSGANAPNLLITEKLLKSRGRPLQHAVRHWLRHLRLADNVGIEDIARGVNLYHMEIRGRGKRGTENVADVGYGVSQVLPVIVQGLLVPRGGIYMVQQPELHLHPDAQAAMADYFIYLVEAGVRVIVETHSEYLLLRVRRRLAEIQSQRRSRKAHPYHWISRDTVSVLRTVSEAGGARVSELKIGSGFQFENLPADFMRQSLDDRLRLLKTMARHG
jgi:predicted ATPase